MENKPPVLAVLSLFLAILSLNISSNNKAAAQQTRIPVRVGVVLDMDSYDGRMGLNCINMALSDFYTTHGHYKTKIVLYKRDSKRDVVGAAEAARDLLKNVKVQAILGPLSSDQANFMIRLGDKAKVPIITFSATSPSLSSIRSQYFIRAALNDSSQVNAISTVVQAFGWKEVVLIYVDNEFGEGIIPSLTKALEQINAHVPYRRIIPPSATDDQIVAELYKLRRMRTRVFVVHMLKRLASHLFTRAELLGMMSGEYAWIATDGITNELSSMDPSVIESMLGVIGVKPYIAKTKELDNFKFRYRQKLQQNNPAALSQDLNIFGLWAYDSVIALALAVEEVKTRNSTFPESNTSNKSLDIDGLGMSSSETELIQVLSNTTFGGLTGNFKLIGGQLQSPPYEIVNVNGPGARVVGYWTKENGVVREINHRNSKTTRFSISMSHVGPIIWPGDKTSPPKGSVLPMNGRKLRIGVPVQDGYTEFVDITWNANNLTEVRGYSIDVFDAVMKTLPDGVHVPYEYIPFATADHKSAGNYNDLVYQVYLGNFDAVVGDVTIVANRSQYVDFTLPYTESGVSMVVQSKDDKRKSFWVFLKPFTWELWVTSFCSFVFMGFLIWILEHRTNEDFRGSPRHQVGTIFWFAFSTMVFAHKEKVTSNLARCVLVTWFLVVLILTQTYTASLASMLTVQQLKPSITDINELIRNNENVGYHKTSFVFGLLKSMKLDESKLVPYSSPEEVDELFSKGTKNGGIAAIFDEIPYIKLILSKYCSKYTMVGPTYKTGGFAFVFPIGSSLVPDISRGILNVTESERMREIEKTWLGDETKCPDSSTLVSSNSIGLESFGGLFSIIGIVAVLALIIYVIKFLRENWNVFDNSNPESTIWSKTMELLRRFNNRDPGSHNSKNEQTERHSSLTERVTESRNECSETSPSTFPLTSPHTNGTRSPTYLNPDSPTRKNVDFQVEEENQFTKQQRESSQEIKDDIELANANQNKQLTSNLNNPAM